MIFWVIIGLGVLLFVIFKVTSTPKSPAHNTEKKEKQNKEAFKEEIKND